MLTFRWSCATVVSEDELCHVTFLATAKLISMSIRTNVVNSTQMGYLVVLNHLNVTLCVKFM